MNQRAPSDKEPLYHIEPLKRTYKRAFDIVLLIIAHLTPPFPIIWLLLWVVIPAAIWINDRGPIFYRQRRVGLGGREFNVFKFRSMIPDAESMTGAIWSPKEDSRITRVGKFLRATALDELPQVVNILLGQMSFVGPRAERLELYRDFMQNLPEFSQRVAVRPGLTGLAQVNGGYDMPPEEKLAYDVEYIRRMNPWLDSLLILRSILTTITARWDAKGHK